MDFNNFFIRTFYGYEPSAEFKYVYSIFNRELAPLEMTDSLLMHEHIIKDIATNYFSAEEVKDLLFQIFDKIIDDNSPIENLNKIRENVNRLLYFMDWYKFGYQNATLLYVETVYKNWKPSQEDILLKNECNEIKKLLRPYVKFYDHELSDAYFNLHVRFYDACGFIPGHSHVDSARIVKRITGSTKRYPYARKFFA